MDTINKIELTDPAVYPDDERLKGVLGNSFDAYRELLDLYSKNEMQWAWRYYRDGKAWLCKVQKKTRTLVWMSAWKGYMQAAVYIPLRLLDEVYALPLEAETKARIEKTRDVGRSKPCIFEIRSTDILKDLDLLIQFKMTAK